MSSALPYGDRVAVAFNLNRCGPGKSGTRCWTVMHVKGRTGRGKVIGYSEEVLLEDVVFKASAAGIRRIRDRGQREVIAWAVGTLRDPELASGLAGRWSGFGFNPYRDDEGFVLYQPLTRTVRWIDPGGQRRQTRVGDVLWEAPWVFFSKDKRAMVKTTRANPHNWGVVTLDQLNDAAARIGGDAMEWSG